MSGNQTVVLDGEGAKENSVTLANGGYQDVRITEGSSNTVALGDAKGSQTAAISTSSRNQITFGKATNSGEQHVIIKGNGGKGSAQKNTVSYSGSTGGNQHAEISASASDSKVTFKGSAGTQQATIEGAKSEKNQITFGGAADEGQGVVIDGAPKNTITFEKGAMSGNQTVVLDGEGVEENTVTLANGG